MLIHRKPASSNAGTKQPIRPLIPPAKRCGNKRTVDVRAVVNGVMYVLSIGCQWAVLPKGLPPGSTVNDYFQRWDWDGTLVRINHALDVQCRKAAGREVSPTTAIVTRRRVPDIDSQSVKGAEQGGARSVRRATMAARRSKAGGGPSSSTCKAC
jgi:transposase